MHSRLYSAISISPFIEFRILNPTFTYSLFSMFSVKYSLLSDAFILTKISNNHILEYLNIRYYSNFDYSVFDFSYKFSIITT